jgi:hypothetical protein
MKTLENKLIIYDSNCKVCSSMRDVILRVTPIKENKIKAFKDLSSDLSPKVDPEKFRNEMALIDTAGAKTIYGAEGVAYIFSSQYKVVDFLLKFKPLFLLFEFLYKVQAYNRYIIATPKSNFHCDCFPEKVLPYRLAYIVLTVASAVFLTILFGVSLRKHFDTMSAQEAGMQMLLMAGTGWVLQIIAATIFLKDKALDYVGHLGSIMVVGLLILVPGILFYFFTGILSIYIPIVSVLISSLTMLYLHIHRTRHLEVSQWWTFSWFFFLQSTAFGWVYYFHLKLFL